MKIVLLVVGPLFIAVGLFWFGQGTGLFSGPHNAVLIDLFSPSPLALGAVALNPGLSEQRSAYEISRSPELHRAAADRVEACERALAVWPPFLRALAVSPPSFSPSPSAPHSSSRFMPS